MIDLENWTFCQYKSPKLKAFISMGGELSEDHEVNFIYNVTVTDFFDKEVYQFSYPELSQAIDLINTKYNHWDFNNLTVTAPQEDDGGGCGSCAAH